jgi:ubiquinone/menaquinone biosynthesis C-methylase UbiE
MYRAIIDKLRCPACGKEITIDVINKETDEIIEGTVVCLDNHMWRIHDGVLNFNSEEQKLGNNWMKLYEQYDYNELDQLIMNNVPEIQKEGYKKAIKNIISTIEESNTKSIIDIATGRGMLLVDLVKHFGDNLDIVCIDLSHIVLKYDRLKCLDINSSVKINYIACDATNLPLQDNSADLALSFFGIANIGEYAEAGVREAHRVSRVGLINIGITIRDDNPHIHRINKSLLEAGDDFTLDSSTETGFRNIHKIEGIKFETNNIFHGDGMESNGDLIPIEGEWFALTIGRTYK